MVQTAYRAFALLAAGLWAPLTIADSGTAAADEPLSVLPYTPSLDTAAMDRGADPCVDFYQYACGGWMQRNPIPADQSSWSVYGKLYADNQRYLWAILAGLGPQTPGRNANQQKIGDYFAACMDEQAVERQGAMPLQPTLAQIDALRSRRELPGLLARLHLDSGDGKLLFAFTSNPDFADSTQVIAFAVAGGLGLPDRDYYLDDDARTLGLRAAYVEHVARMLQLLGDEPAKAHAAAATVLRIETQLARATLTRVERRDPYKLFHKFDRAQLQLLTPEFDWDAYLGVLGLRKLNRFNVSQPAFIAAVNALLAGSPLADLQTYLRWHAVDSAAPQLSAAFVEENFAFYQHTLRGVPSQKPRWKRCVALVDSQLGEALGQEFVARAFSAKLKAATLKLTRQIEQAMREDIEQLSWMGPATKQQALTKLAAIVNKVGYPERWRDYGAVYVRHDDFYGNVIRASRFEQRRQLDKIGKPLDRNEWAMTPPTVNAYYSWQLNDINFPAGVLQPPLYDAKLDDAPNYGDTGGTIGHELTHGFDDQGRKFDATGNLKDWWTAADAAAFGERAQCIVNQYAEYIIVDDIHINSRLTLGEDIADLGGLILAHMAWRAETAGQSLSSRDALTPEQRFFVGYAQWACENVRPESLRVQAKTDPHSPGKYRVNGLMVDLPEFQRAFACQSGQPLTRENRCRVW